MGGLHWKLGDVRDGVCYLGLVYKKIESDSKNKNACCAAQMFLDSGNGMVFRGNVVPWWNPKSGEFHLSEQDAFEIISQSLESYFSRFNSYPNEIFIHARTYFDDAEWSGFEEAVKGKSPLETPNPVEISITRGDADIDVVCKDILSLTKLNYNACNLW